MKHEDTSIRWYETLARGDVATSRRQRMPRSARWCSALAAAGVRVPAGLRDDGRGLPRAASPAAASATRSQARLARTRDAARATPGARRARPIRRLILDADFPQLPRRTRSARLPQRSAERRGVTDAARVAVRSQRHRRGPARRELRRAAEDLPQRPGRPRRSSPRAAGAWHRSSPTARSAIGGPRLRPHGGRALGWRPADGALRPRWFGRYVLDRHRDRFRQGRADPTAAWGLGENVVQGTVDPDEYQGLQAIALIMSPPNAHRREALLGAKAQKLIYAEGDSPTRNVPTSKAERSAYVLSDDEIRTSARWAVTIETHYGCPMDMEWARDGETGRPVHCPGSSRDGAVTPCRGAAPHSIGSQGRARLLTNGIAIGDATGEKPCPPLRSDRVRSCPTARRDCTALGPRLHDVHPSVLAVAGPFHVHRAAVMRFDCHGPASERQDFAVAEHEGRHARPCSSARLRVGCSPVA